MKVWKVSQLLQCAFHTEDRKLRFFLLLFIYFLSWKKLQLWISSWVVFIARGGAHWAELRQRYHCGLKERQGINAAIWSPLRLWGCIIKMTRMRPRTVTSLLPAGHADVWAGGFSHKFPQNGSCFHCHPVKVPSCGSSKRFLLSQRLCRVSIPSTPLLDSIKAALHHSAVLAKFEMCIVFALLPIQYTV